MCAARCCLRLRKDLAAVADLPTVAFALSFVCSGQSGNVGNDMQLIQGDGTVWLPAHQYSSQLWMVQCMEYDQGLKLHLPIRCRTLLQLCRDYVYQVMMDADACNHEANVHVESVQLSWDHNSTTHASIASRAEIGAILDISGLQQRPARKARGKRTGGSRGAGDAVPPADDAEAAELLRQDAEDATPELHDPDDAGYDGWDYS
eukprot:9407908-Alexandrium_andersonii.AAC.1